MPSFLQPARAHAGAFLARLAVWAEANPRRAGIYALLLMWVVVGCETAYWPLNQYPNALWHKSPRGLDVEIPQEKAAHMTWPILASYWVSGQIEGNGYYRPLTSWLYVAEYQLFGRNDAAWCNLNILLHLAVAAAILWLVALIRAGPLLARLGTGMLACVFFSAPGFADRGVHYWTIGWWPAQPENITLLITLGMLGFAVLHRRTGHRRYAVLLPVLLLLGICFKEMTYVGGVGVCLFLLRERRQWRLLAGFAAFMGVLLFVRHLILPQGQGLLIRPGHFLRFANLALTPVVSMVEEVDWPHGVGLVMALLLGQVVIVVSRKRWSWPARGVLAAALYVTVSLLVFDVETATVGGWVLVDFLLFLVVAYGVLRKAVTWPVGELVLLYLGASWVVAGYPPYFGWYRLWPGVLASILAAIAWSDWMALGWTRFGGRRLAAADGIRDQGAGIGCQQSASAR